MYIKYDFKSLIKVLSVSSGTMRRSIISTANYGVFSSENTTLDCGAL